MPKSDVMITLICVKSDQRNLINPTGKYIQQATITMNINIKEYKY